MGLGTGFLLLTSDSCDSFSILRRFDERLFFPFLFGDFPFSIIGISHDDSSLINNSGFFKTAWAFLVNNTAVLLFTPDGDAPLPTLFSGLHGGVWATGSVFVSPSDCELSVTAFCKILAAFFVFEINFFSFAISERICLIRLVLCDGFF